MRIYADKCKTIKMCRNKELNMFKYSLISKLVFYTYTIFVLTLSFILGFSLFFFCFYLIILCQLKFT